MNVHAPIEIQNKFLSLEFRGKPFRYKNRKVISARHKSTGFKYLYSFEEDFAWMMTNNDSVPDWFIRKI